MRVAGRITLALLVAILAATSSIDILGASSPWIAVCAAALASAWTCSAALPAALCAATAVSLLELLVSWRGAFPSLGQAAAHVAAAALLAAAFSLTSRTAADNSANSQARSAPSDPLPKSDEVNDED